MTLTIKLILPEIANVLMWTTMIPDEDNYHSLNLVMVLF